MFKKITDFFVSKKLFKDPLFQAAKIASDNALEETGLGKQRDKMKLNIEGISEEITSIIESEDRFNLLRQKIGETVSSYARFQVLVLDSKKEDKTGLVGLPGITGDLNKHIIKIADLDETMQEEIHGWEDPSKKNDYTFMKSYILSKYLIWYWRHAIFDALRIETKDYNQNIDKDWSKPFLYSMCAFEEYNYREKLKLKQELDGMQSVQNATFLDLVLKGEKYPDLAFYKLFKDPIDAKRLYFKYR